MSRSFIGLCVTTDGLHSPMHGKPVLRVLCTSNQPGHIGPTIREFPATGHSWTHNVDW